MQTLERPDLLLTALGFACFAFLGPASGSTTFYGPPLFVASTLANSVAVIDSAANQVTTAIPVGRSPTRISLSPNGMKVHVSNTGSNTVSVIDTLKSDCNGHNPDRTFGSRGAHGHSGWKMRSAPKTVLAVNSIRSAFLRIAFIGVLSLVWHTQALADCSLTSTGITPVNDLWPGLYQNYAGGNSHIFSADG